MAVSMSDMMKSSVTEIKRYQAELSTMQEKMTKGVKILSADDDPVAFARIQTMEKKIAELEGYETSGALAKMRLNIGDVAMTGSLDALQRARELALQASSDTQTAESRQAIAVEVRGIVERMLSMSNTQDGDGNYMFGGDNVEDLPFKATRDPITDQILKVEYVGSESAHRMAKIGMDSGGESAVGSTRIQMSISGSSIAASQENAYNQVRAYMPEDPSVMHSARGVEWDASVGVYRYSNDPAGNALGDLRTDPVLMGLPAELPVGFFAKESDGSWVNSMYSAELDYIESNDLVPMNYVDFEKYDPATAPISSDYNKFLLNSYDVSDPFSPNFSQSSPNFSTDIYEGFVESESFRVSMPGGAFYDPSSSYYDATLEGKIQSYMEHTASNPTSAGYDASSPYYSAALETQYDVSNPSSVNYDKTSADYDAKLDVSSSSFEPMDSQYDPNRKFDYVRGEPVPFENSNDAPTSIFESLIRLAERLENNQDVAPSISNIDNNIEALSASRAQIGTYLNTIETQLDINDSFKLEFKETLSDLKDLDMAEAIMEFQTKMMALQLAQQAFQQIKEMSMASKNIF